MVWYRPTSTKKISDNFADHKARKSVNPGVDYPVGMGTPVMAVAGGKVNKVVDNVKGAAGRVVLMQHGSYKADYIHLSKILVAKGQVVQAGDVIGLSGASGLGKERGYGPHLHFSIRKGGMHLSGRGNLDFEAFMKAENAKQTAPVAPAAPSVVAAPVTSAPAAQPKRPTIKQGSKGKNVAYLQSKLGINADGIFGPKTKAAVVSFQNRRGLVADGIVGPKTWEAVG
jgi:murein DD-endopeptidase MepM/ murein hydrolase activator NlpD